MNNEGHVDTEWLTRKANVGIRMDDVVLDSRSLGHGFGLFQQSTHCKNGLIIPSEVSEKIPWRDVRPMVGGN